MNKDNSTQIKQLALEIINLRGQLSLKSQSIFTDSADNLRYYNLELDHILNDKNKTEFLDKLENEKKNEPVLNYSI